MRAAAVLIAALSLGACTTNDMRQEPIEQALSQPFKDISLLREETPALLKSAAKAPYGPPADCAAITGEIAELNKLLGRDFDAGVAEDGQTGAMIMSQLIGGVVEIPLRGVIRQVTGANRRDREKAEAIVASVARRGYLRGLAEERKCTAAPAPVQAAATTP